MASEVAAICTFLNAESTLEATLESLRCQTCADSSFILVDDGSMDGSAAIADSFCRIDRRFSLRHNAKPGRGRALNLAAFSADAEYIAILDADDVAHPAWLMDLLAIIRARPEFAVVGCERILIRDDERPEWDLAEEARHPEIRDATRGLARANVVAHSGVIIRLGRLREVGGYDAARESLFDYDLWIRLAQSGRRLGVSSQMRIAKRYHVGQKFAHTKGYSVAAWREQLRAIMAIDRDYRNFLRLGLRIASDITRRPRRAVAAGMKRR